MLGGILERTFQPTVSEARQRPILTAAYLKLWIGQGGSWFRRCWPEERPCNDEEFISPYNLYFTEEYTQYCEIGKRERGHPSRLHQKLIHHGARSQKSKFLS
jgi:hypothetical protein